MALPSYAAPAAFGPGITVLYCVERGVNAGSYAPALIVSTNATFSTDGNCDLQFSNEGSPTPFIVRGATYSASATGGTWKPVP